MNKLESTKNKDSLSIIFKFIKYLITSVFISVFVLFFPTLLTIWLDKVTLVNFVGDEYGVYRFLLELMVVSVYVAICGYIYTHIHYKDKFIFIFISVILSSIFFWLFMFDVVLIELLELISSCNKEFVEYVGEVFAPSSILITLYKVIFIISAFFTHKLLNKNNS